VIVLRIELLSAPGCPHAAAAKKTITDCLTALRIDVPIIEMQRRLAGNAGLL
jgi:glutaredoxin